jgi:NADPH:quinone reductase-like Zn-dependent oxidoreductase
MSHMQAIVQTRYGSPDVLALREVEMPPVGDGEVLIRVQAASVNALDWHTTRGMPYLIRLSEGVRRPRHPIRGVDLAGRVEAVGRDVTQFRPGDPVFGGGNGSFAEYAVTTPDRLAPWPPGFTGAEAAALHVAGLTALQGLRDRARLQPGQRVLINGAGGGVGTLAVQIARWLGAEVTAVTRTESVEMVRALGANHVMDHRREDFTRRHERYDILFDIGGNRPLRHCRRVLARNGILVAVGAPAGRWLAPASRMLAAAVLSPFGSQRLAPFLSRNDGADLALVAELATKGRLRPVIDREYPLPEAAEAVWYVGTGHPRGKVAIAVGPRQQ